MTIQVVCRALVLMAVVSPLFAQDTKTFPEAECSFTLPNGNWEWADPQMIRGNSLTVIAIARNQTGLVFILSYDDVGDDERVSLRLYESYEMGFLQSGGYKKLGAKHLTFKGVPSYRLDAQRESGQGTSSLVLYANERFYQLQLVNGLGSLGPEEGWTSVFDGFNFTGQVRPMLPSDLDRSFRRGEELGRSANYFLFLLIAIVGILLLMWVIYKIVNRNQTPPIVDNQPDQ